MSKLEKIVPFPGKVCREATMAELRDAIDGELLRTENVLMFNGVPLHDVPAQELYEAVHGEKHLMDSRRGEK